jgi:chromosome segregation ATPase
MGIVIGALALLVALAAAWLASEAFKRVDRMQRTFVETHLRPLRDDMDRATQQAGDAATRSHTLEKRLAEIAEEMDRYEERSNRLVQDLRRLQDASPGGTGGRADAAEREGGAERRDMPVDS